MIRCRYALGSSRFSRSQCLSKALAEEIRHLDEEGAAIPAQARFELLGKGTKAAPVNVIVIANVQSGAWIRRPAKQELALDVRGNGIKVDPPAGKDEPRELIGGAH